MEGAAVYRNEMIEGVGHFGITDKFPKITY